MNKKQVRKIFKERKIQINGDAVNMVLDHVNRYVIQMADRCKDGNYKRLTPESFWVATGDWGIPPNPKK